jgi:tetratricopeptide (TPR) repeat protein
MHWTIRTVSLVLLAVVLLLAGCREQMPETDLDRFVAALDGLTTEAKIDTLRQIATDSPPESVYANYQLGNVYYEAAVDSARVRGWNHPSAAARLDSAEVYFNRAVAQDSLMVEAYVNLGAVWDDRSEMIGKRGDRVLRQEKAEQMYSKALAIDPHNEKARCNLGALYMRVNRTTDAKNEFQQVLAVDPHSALAHYNLAIMFAESKLYDEAILEWKLAAKYDRDGDIGERSRENVKIVEELQQTKTPQKILTP